MKINAVFESASRRRMRTIKTLVIMIAYLAAVMIFSFAQLAIFSGEVKTVQMRKSTEWYIWINALQLALIVLVAPALGAGSIAGERERQTFDLLLVTGIGVRRIVLGKIMESFAFLALILASAFPIMALSCVISGMKLIEILCSMVYLMVISIEALSVGVLLSVICSRTMTAIIGAYITVFSLGVLSWILAKHGPLAAAYTYQSLQALSDLEVHRVLLGMPVPIFFNPAVGLVTMLAHQTGILHRTIESTLRLYDIYHAARVAGFGAVSFVCFISSCFSTVVMIVLATLILHINTGSGRNR